MLSEETESLGLDWQTALESASFCPMLCSSPRAYPSTAATHTQRQRENAVTSFESDTNNQHDEKDIMDIFFCGGTLNSTRKSSQNGELARPQLPPLDLEQTLDPILTAFLPTKPTSHTHTAVRETHIPPSSRGRVPPWQLTHQQHGSTKVCIYIAWRQIQSIPSARNSIQFPQSPSTNRALISDGSSVSDGGARTIE